MRQCNAKRIFLPLVILMLVIGVILYYVFNNKNTICLKNKENKKTECIWSQVKTIGGYDFTFSQVKIEKKLFYMIHRSNTPDYFKIIEIKNNNTLN